MQSQALPKKRESSELNKNMDDEEEKDKMDQNDELYDHFTSISQTHKT